jgi:hypothetical protein
MAIPPYVYLPLVLRAYSFSFCVYLPLVLRAYP